MQRTNKVKPLFLKKKSGQAAVEYVLLVGMMAVIFAVIFSNLRKTLFKLWVCEMGPRIESTTACAGSASSEKCWSDLIVQTTGSTSNENIRALQEACRDAAR